MAFTPWLNSTDLVAAIKRKISIPSVSIAGGFSPFTDQELLSFANEEMAIALVPQVLEYHSEFFVVTDEIPLVANQVRYPVPDRAIGLRIRNLFFKDNSGNIYEMVVIDPSDKAYFQYTSLTDFGYRYYLEGNDILLTANALPNPSGSLVFSYYLRPNQLVETTRAFIISSLVQVIEFSNASVVNGNTVTITQTINGNLTSHTLTMVTGAPGPLQFQKGVNGGVTAANLAVAIDALGLGTTSTGTGSLIGVTTVKFTNPTTVFSGTGGFPTINVTGVQSTAAAPANLTTNSLVDILQTKPGHKTLNRSIKIQSINTTDIANDTLYFKNTDIPPNLAINDYVCSENECIIPQVPTDLHIGLAERASARVLASIGDREGLAVVEGKIKQVEEMQKPLLGARDEGDTKKVLNRKSLLRLGKYINYRKY